ncbi:YARHG domain-containing protein [Pedobacter psychrotolerans]|uniref:YARHG domain-containing protein n=2 Tax=Pedobacter psychrotolerans TaxID=1843235 RepID=A0A4R2H997_9SPHI|nr:YARHG domain-containing protein [Pedobacter psychrotolerans]TCO23579.1 YARHG domain-containing protein [Pedobacter psychrotolerans]
MKRILMLLLIAVSMMACKETKKTGKDSQKKVAITQKEIHKELYGFWVGNFVASEDYEYQDDTYAAVKKLNINIKKITKDTVIAQSIVSGNSRPLLGKISENGGKITFILDEPGTDQYDGKFEITLIGDALIGEWNAYKTALKWPKKEFKLVKKAFVYNANLMLPTEADYIDWTDHKMVESLDTLEDGTIDSLGANTFYRSASEGIFKINASNMLLKEEDVKNLRKLDLQIIKNTIFARHGYAFKKQTLRNFFDPVEWYVPVKNNVDNDLTPIENKNVKLLDRFTKYAEDNYDTFGR